MLDKFNNDDKSSLPKLSKAILHDQALASCLLKVANSVQHLSVNKVSTVSRASVVLGIQAVKNICLTSRLVEGLLANKDLDVHVHQQLTQSMANSFHAGLLAKMMAPQYAEDTQEELYLAAMLYRIGETAFWGVGGDSAKSLATFVDTTPAIFQKKCHKELGGDFTQLSGELAKTWSLRISWNKVKIEWRGKSLTEPHIELDGSDTLIVGQFKCGERYGEWKSFFTNNKIKTIAYYKQGLYDGPYKIYHENGYVLESGTKISGKTERLVKYYYPDGSIKKTLEFENNKLNGQTKSYSEKGLVTHLETYKNDMLFGPAKSYYPSGKVKLEAKYNHDEKLSGLLKKYREDGSLDFEREYKSGNKTGYYKSYHKNGKLFIDAHTIDDLYDGEYKEYFDNGTLRCEGNHTNDKRVGLWKQYLQNGQLNFLGHFLVKME